MPVTWVRDGIGCSGAIQKFLLGQRKKGSSHDFLLVYVIVPERALVYAVISHQPSGDSYLLYFFLPKASGRLSTHLKMQLWIWECQPYLAKCSSVFFPPGAPACKSSSNWSYLVISSHHVPLSQFNSLFPSFSLSLFLSLHIPRLIMQHNWSPPYFISAR